MPDFGRDASDAAVYIGGVTLSRHLPLDGAMGTELVRRYAAPANQICRWHLEHPEAVRNVWKASVAVGAQAITTNTLTAPFALDGDMLVRRSVALAREVAAQRPVFVSLAPLILEPAVGWQRLADAAAAAGGDMLLLETATDLELLAAVVREVRKAASALPIVASFVADPAIFPMDDLQVATARLAGAGVAAIGINCVAPDQGTPVLHALAAALPATFSLVVRFSAGTPVYDGVSSTYPWRPGPWADAVKNSIHPLPNVVAGGCCGAGSDFIAALARRLVTSAGDQT